MFIGKAGQAATSISTADATAITRRGHDLCSGLMGSVGFIDNYFALTKRRQPSDGRRAGGILALADKRDGPGQPGRN